MVTLTIVNADGLDASGFPGFTSLAPVINAYFEASGTLKAKIMTGNWIQLITPTPFLEVGGTSGKFSITFPSGFSAGSYVLIIDADGISIVWTYFSTGFKVDVPPQPIITPREIAIGVAGLVGGASIGYTIGKK